MFFAGYFFEGLARALDAGAIRAGIDALALCYWVGVLARLAGDCQNPLNSGSESNCSCVISTIENS